MNNGLHDQTVIRYTTQGDLACSWCGYRIPTRKTSRNTEALLEWSSADVMGLFCSESHAIAATNNVQWREQYSFKVGA